MGAESAAPFIVAASGFSLLLCFLAFAVQRQSLFYRGIAGSVAVVATLMTTLSYVEIASLRQPDLSAAHTDAAVEKVVTTEATCVRQGIVPACSCAGQR
jgi:hypothetical protein